MQADTPIAVGTPSVPSHTNVGPIYHRAGRSLLASASDALERAGIAWLILRGLDDAGRCRELDVVVQPKSMDAIAAALRPLGFREVLEPGRGSHRFLVTYDDEQDLWLKLDLVDEIAVGPVHEVRIAGAKEVLARRTWSDGLPVLHDGDELWATLLHTVGDRPIRGKVRTLDPDRVRRMSLNADASSPLAAPFVGLSPGGRGEPAPLSGPVAAIDLARNGDIDALARMTRAAIDRKRTARSAASIRSARHAVRHVIRRLRSTLTVPARPGGTILVLLGPDGAGKSGLAATLANDTPLPVRLRYLGLFGAAGPGRLFGSRGLGRLWWIVRASVAAGLDRRRGRIVVFDRYVDDIRRGKDRRSRLRRAVYHGLAVRPDIILVLDAPGVVLHARRPEHPVDESERDRQRYLALAADRPEAAVIDATRSPANVAAAAQRVLWARLATRV